MNSRKVPGLRVEMTRNDDTFLRLTERVRIARQYEADLFISLHADTINQRQYPRSDSLYCFG